MDSSLLEILTNRPSRLSEILAIETVRDAALRISRPRTGALLSENADITANERLQTLRHNGKLTYDPATSRSISRSKKTIFRSPMIADAPLLDIT